MGGGTYWARRYVRQYAKLQLPSGRSTLSQLPVYGSNLSLSDAIYVEYVSNGSYSFVDAIKVFCCRWCRQNETVIMSQRFIDEVSININFLLVTYTIDIEKVQEFFHVLIHFLSAGIHVKVLI